eukprot:NODE_698_length_4656_cov_1.141321.p2 type:complete len:225 gc:universal NODE_698_length_4656_cov_1.141321:3549-4223(+)
MFLFDVDNTLYHHSKGVGKLMADKIIEYCKTLGYSYKESADLSLRYYIDYGLAIRGFVKHHNIDPLDYDLKVDQSLPLDGLIKEDVELRNILMKCNQKRWVFTNAARPHCIRVLKLLNVSDCFSGITHCKYENPNFYCKPDVEYYYEVLKESNYDGQETIYFVDDSLKNCKRGQELGWKVCHVLTGDYPDQTTPMQHITSLGIFNLFRYHPTNQDDSRYCEYIS